MKNAVLKAQAMLLIRKKVVNKKRLANQKTEAADLQKIPLPSDLYGRIPNEKHEPTASKMPQNFPRFTGFFSLHSLSDRSSTGKHLNEHNRI